MTTYIGNKPDLTKVRDEYIGKSPNGDAGANAAGIPYDSVGNTYVLGADVQAALDSTDSAMLVNDTLRLTNRDAGLTAIASPQADLNNIVKSGFYNIGNTELNRPTDDGILKHQERNGVQASQLFYGVVTGATYIRVRSGVGVWGVWDRITNNVHKDGDSIQGAVSLDNAVYLRGQKLDLTLTNLLGIDAIDVVTVGPADSPTLEVEARGVWDFFDSVPSTPFNAVNPEDLTRRDYVDSRLLTLGDVNKSTIDYDLDLDALVVSGMYRPITGALNTPDGLLNGTLTVMRNADLCTQHYIDTVTGEIYVRTASSVLAVPVWIAWTSQPNQASTDLRYLRKDQDDTTVGNITILNNLPAYAIREEDAALDEKVWTWYAQGAQFRFMAGNDADTISSNWLLVDRTGIIVDKITFDASEMRCDTPLFSIVDNAPSLQISESDAGVNEKNWRFSSFGGSFQLRPYSDAGSAGALAAMSLDRTGTTVDAITLRADKVNVQHPTLPVFSMIEDDAALDEKIWSWISSGGTFSLRTRSDAFGTIETPILLERTGGVVDKITFDASDVEMQGITTISAAGPILKLNETDQGLNEKAWTMQAFNSSLVFRAFNDVFDTQTTFMQVDRTGLTIDRIILTATEMRCDTPLFSVVDNTPVLQISESDAAVDEKNWALRSVAGIFRLSTYTDAGAIQFHAISVERTGVVVDKIKLSATEINLDGFVTASSLTPRYTLYETDAPLDEKYSDIIAVEGQLRFRVYNDAILSFVNYMTVDRTGTTVDSITLSTKTDGIIDLKTQTLRMDNASATLEMDDTVGVNGTRAKRITCNDGGGNWNFRGSSYFSTSEKYQTTGSGATHIVQNFEGQDAILSLKAAAIGTAGASITWGATIDIVPTKITLEAPTVDIVGTLLNNGLPISGGGDTVSSGNWTPVLWDNSGSSAEGQTYSIQTGTWTKMGNRVILQGTMQMSSLGTLGGLGGTDDVRIGGQPFPITATANSDGTMTIGQAENLLITAGQTVTGSVRLFGSSMYLFVWSLAGGTTELTFDKVTATSKFVFTAIYTTDS